MEKKIAVLGQSNHGLSSLVAEKLAEKGFEARLVGLDDLQEQRESYMHIPYELAPYIAMAKSLEPRPSKSEKRRGCSNGHSYKPYNKEVDEHTTVKVWMCDKCGKMM